MWIVCRILRIELKKLLIPIYILLYYTYIYTHTHAVIHSSFLDIILYDIRTLHMYV